MHICHIMHSAMCILLFLTFFGAHYWRRGNPTIAAEMLMGSWWIWVESWWHVSDILMSITFRQHSYEWPMIKRMAKLCCNSGKVTWECLSTLPRISSVHMYDPNLTISVRVDNDVAPNGIRKSVCTLSIKRYALQKTDNQWLLKRSSPILLLNCHISISIVCHKTCVWFRYLQHILTILCNGTCVYILISLRDDVFLISATSVTLPQGRKKSSSTFSRPIPSLAEISKVTYKRFWREK